MANGTPMRAEDNNFLAKVAAGNIAEARRCLESGANINAVNVLNWNGLEIAVKNDDAPMAAFLLDEGVSWKVVNDSWISPIAEATRKKNTDMVETMLQHGVDPNWPPRKDDPSLTLEQQNSFRGFLSLHQAAKDGNTEMVRLLLDHGADHNIQTRMIGRPLYFAVISGKQEATGVLLAAGADPNGDSDMRHGDDEPVYHQQSVLFNLLEPQHAEMLRMCLDAGADVERRNEKGLSVDEVLKEKCNDLDYRALSDIYKPYREMPQMTDAALDGLTREALFAPNAAGYCLMESPSTWKQFSKVADKLAAQGEALTAADLEANNQNGKSWLERGAECFAAHEALSCYVQAGGNLTEALVQKNNAPTALLSKIIERQQGNRLMDAGLWHDAGASRSDFRRVSQLIPQDQQIGANKFQIAAQLDNAQARGPGR